MHLYFIYLHYLFESSTNGFLQQFVSLLVSSFDHMSRFLSIEGKILFSTIYTYLNMIYFIAEISKEASESRIIYKSIPNSWFVLRYLNILMLNVKKKYISEFIWFLRIKIQDIEIK